ncbi:hypothetical protein chiPu_0020536 [Chiloscyllium punctatum]|uniref:Mitochondrial ribosomal protein S21 n=1 Tax=Chiloscyllium punctatum TaxID=137246 RepID=A0A401RGS7_CHIPU|nr:hypothetical protein [Chiloscyllium punctatum]
MLEEGEGNHGCGWVTRGVEGFLIFIAAARKLTVPPALASLPRILTTDGIIDEAKRRRYYEKPCRKRIRENYETCRRIYNMEMARKLTFLMRKNRQDPWLGC